MTEKEGLVRCIITRYNILIRICILRGVVMKSKVTVRKKFHDLLWLWSFTPIFGIYKAAYSKKIDLHSYFASYEDVLNFRQLHAFFSERWPALILACVFAYLYYAVTMENKFTVRTASDVFSPEEMPADWQKFVGKDVYQSVIILNIVQFVLLGLAIDDIIAFSVVLLAFFSVSVIGNYNMRKIVNTYFDDPFYFPNETYKFTSFINSRRVVVRRFVNRIHAEKDLFVSIGCILVILLAHFDMPRGITYPLLALLIFANEFTVWWWRSIRNKAIDEINSAQDAYEIAQEESKKTPLSLQG